MLSKTLTFYGKIKKSQHLNTQNGVIDLEENLRDSSEVLFEEISIPNILDVPEDEVVKAPK